MGSVICEEKRAPVASLLSSVNLKSDGRAVMTRDVARHAYIKAALGQLNVLRVNVDGRYSMPLHLEREREAAVAPSIRFLTVADARNTLRIPLARRSGCYHDNFSRLAC